MITPCKDSIMSGTCGVKTRSGQPGRWCPTPAEARGALLRLLERHGGLNWETLTAEQRDALELLADDGRDLLRWDREVLLAWAASKGIDLSDCVERPDVAVVYTAR